MADNIKRREFLKLAGAASLGLALPSFNQHNQNTISPGGKANILIVVLDALSAYHLSIYGYVRETMPNLKRLADRAIVYHNHFSGGNYTTPGTASILTGTLPWSHRAIVHNDTVADEFINKNIFQVFPNYYRMAYSHNTLVTTQLKQFADHINEYTPRNTLFIDNYRLFDRIFSSDGDIASLSWVRALKQMDDGTSYSLFTSQIMDEIIERRTRDLAVDYPRGLPNINIDDYFTFDKGIDFLIQQIDRVPRPFLGYYHFLPPHAPYNPSKEFVGSFDGDGYRVIEKERHVFSRGKSIKQLNKENTEYDEFILYADQAFARLFDTLDQKGILEDTWVVLTSDHGELFERGIIGHMTPMLIQAVIRVPLFIFEPGRDSRLDIYENTSGTDILPTLLSLTGQEIPEWIEGQVLPPFNNTNAQGPRHIFAMQAKGIGKKDPIVKATVMLVLDNYKMMYYFGYRELSNSGPLIELYDVRNDPQEMNNLYPSMKTRGDEMLEIIKTKLEEVDRTP